VVLMMARVMIAWWLRAHCWPMLTRLLRLLYRLCSPTGLHGLIGTRA
jgi:hypothetical protein